MKDDIKTTIIEQPGEISRYKAQRIGRAVEAFFRIPENNERFEQWKAERDKKRKAAQA
ncbi:MAG: hypothetical protein IJ874_09335 [Ruminococcus sp.]|nr:hypothetical protein [Ruminococcus sp.]